MSLFDTNIETDYVRQLSLDFHKSKQISPNFVPSIQRLVLIKSISTQFYTSCNLNDHRKDSEIFKTRVGPQVADPGEVSIQKLPPQPKKMHNNRAIIVLLRYCHYIFYLLKQLSSIGGTRNCKISIFKNVSNETFDNLSLPFVR